MGYFFCKDTYRGKGIIVQIKDIVYFFLRNDQGVAHHQGYDVQESNESLVLSNDLAWYLAVYDLSEYGRHNLRSGRLAISSWRLILNSHSNIQNLKFDLPRHGLYYSRLALFLTEQSFANGRLCRNFPSL